MKSTIQFILILFSLSVCGQGLVVDKAFITIGSDANLILENGAGISLLSDATGTSSLIDDQNINLSGSGTITALRYIPRYIGAAGWHFLSSPVAAQAIRPGFVSNTNPIPGNDDFYKWDEMTNYWINTKDGDGNWNTGFENAFTVGKGYLVAYESDVNKTFSGTLNSGNFAYNSTTSPAITYTSGEGEGWNLMGNPYPSGLDWDALSKTNIDASVYVYDGDAGQYLSWNGTVGALSDGIIPPMNAFYIKASSRAVLTIINDARVHTSANFYKNNENNLIVLKAEGNGLGDRAYIHFNEQATDNFDSQYDAYKLFGIEEAPQIYTLAGENKLSINELPFSAEKTIPLSLKTGKDGMYKISVDNEIMSLPADLFLEDVKEDFTVNLTREGKYEFYSEKEDDTGRFLLYFKTNGVEEENINKLVSVYPNPAHDYIYVEYYESEPIFIDILGINGILLGSIKIFEGKGIDISKLPKGIYMLKTEQGKSIKFIKN